MPQGSVLGPLLFLIYINDLPDNIQSTCKIFADDTSLFSHVFDKYKSQSELNIDLQIISNWAFQWKMQFNPDPNKQSQEVHLLDRLLDKSFIWITETLFMTNHIMSLLKAKLRILNIKLALQ